MLRTEDYVRVDSLSETYELYQKYSSLIMGGMVWPKVTSVVKRTIADLSGLGLGKVQETKEEFKIGAMCTLRQLGTDQGLNQYFRGIFKEHARHTVGVQMRSLVTMGGSIYSRSGFSDILVCLMALDTYVGLYHEGMVPLEEFPKRPVRRDDGDILVRVIIRKDGRKVACTTQKSSETDFPVITCRVSRWGDDWCVTVGARPGRAQVVKIRGDGYDSLVQSAGEVVDSFICSSNTRTSGPYRRQLAVVYTKYFVRRLTGRSASKE